VRKGFADVAKIAIKAGHLDGGRIPLRVGPSGQVRTCIFADLSIAERPLATAQQPLWVRPQVSECAIVKWRVSKESENRAREGEPRPQSVFGVALARLSLAALHFIGSGFFSNPAKDYLEKYRENNRPPFKIKHWELPQLEQLTVGMRKLLNEYGLMPENMRSVKEILRAAKRQGAKCKDTSLDPWLRVGLSRHLNSVAM